MTPEAICARFSAAIRAAAAPGETLSVELKFLPNGVATAIVTRSRAGKAQCASRFQPRRIGSRFWSARPRPVGRRRHRWACAKTRKDDCRIAGIVANLTRAAPRVHRAAPVEDSLCWAPAALSTWMFSRIMARPLSRWWRRTKAKALGKVAVAYRPADKVDAAITPVDPTQADTVPAGTSTTATIAMGSSVDVVIDTIGDHDWYGVTLTAGTTYTIHTSSYNATGADSFLNLRDASGTLITSDDDAGEGAFSLISYTAGRHRYLLYRRRHVQRRVDRDLSPVDRAGSARGRGLGFRVDRDRRDAGGQRQHRRQYRYQRRPRLLPHQPDCRADLYLPHRRHDRGDHDRHDPDAARCERHADPDQRRCGRSRRFRRSAIPRPRPALIISTCRRYNTGTGAFNLTAFTTPTPVVYTNDQIANSADQRLLGRRQPPFRGLRRRVADLQRPGADRPGPEPGAPGAGAVDRRDGDHVQRSHHRRPNRL